MSRDYLLELLMVAIARPYQQCLHRTQNVPSQARRFASTSSSSRSNSAKSLPSKTASPVSKLPPPATKVPLHVGLDRNPENVSAISRIPIPQGVRGENFTPSILARPLGLQFPPRPGQNSPIDHRSLQERKMDFADYDRVMERRKVYLRTFFRPYFQEWKRFDYCKGKSFISNERLFRADKALYFPNIWGHTLSLDGDGPDGGRNTTNVLMDKISIIAVRSNQWANEQVESFLGPKQNPELQQILEQNAEHAQRVDINIQGDWARLMLVRLFKSGIRKEIPEDRWNKYFMLKLPRDVRRGLTDDIRDAMGLLNSQVGYVYLVDQKCKIRWAGSADAWNGEVQGLNAGLRKLLQESSSAAPIRSRIAGVPSTSTSSAGNMARTPTVPRVAIPAS